VARSGSSRHVTLEEATPVILLVAYEGQAEDSFLNATWYMNPTTKGHTLYYVSRRVYGAPIDTAGLKMVKIATSYYRALGFYRPGFPQRARTPAACVTKRAG
jgi:hypothetical protein